MTTRANGAAAHRQRRAAPRLLLRRHEPAHDPGRPDGLRRPAPARHRPVLDAAWVAGRNHSPSGLRHRGRAVQHAARADRRRIHRCSATCSSLCVDLVARARLVARTSIRLRTSSAPPTPLRRPHHPCSVAPATSSPTTAHAPAGWSRRSRSVMADTATSADTRRPWHSGASSADQAAINLCSVASRTRGTISVCQAGCYCAVRMTKASVFLL